MFTKAQLRKLILPLAVQQILVLLVGMIDSVMVSSVGEAALSGVSIVNEVNYLIIVVMDSLASGGSVILAQYLGNKNKDLAQESAGQLILVSFLIPLVLSMLCLTFHSQLLHVIYGGIAPDVMQAADTYFVITLLSFPFLGLYNASNALFRIQSHTNEIMYTSIFMNIINVVGNFIGVYVLKLGVAGVAWPTFIARFIAAIIMFSLCFNEQLDLALYWNKILTFKTQVIQKILTIAIPNALENGLFQFGRIIVTMIISGFGTTQIAANSVAGGLGQLTFIASSTVGLSCMTVVGQCVGANDYDQAKYYTKYLVKIGTIAQIIECAIVYVTLPFTMQMYTMSYETAELVRQIMLVNCITSGLMHSLSFVLPSCLRAAGDVKYSMYVGVLSMFFVRITGAYIMGNILGLGVIGVYYAMYCDWFVRIVCFTYRFKSGKWMNYRIIKD